MEFPTTPENVHLLTARAIFGRLDLSAVEGIGTLILLCFTNRCGSWLLADLLGTSGRIGIAGECLNGDEMARTAERHRLRSFADYVRHAIAGPAVEGNVVLKCGILHLEVLGQSGLLELMGERVRYVHMTRKDRLAQAISWEIAAQTGRWRSGGAAGAEPVFSAAGIAAAMARFEADNRQFEHFFRRNGIVPRHVAYEALVAAPEAVAAGVVDGLFAVPPRFDMRRVSFARQADGRNAAWRERFLAERG